VLPATVQSAIAFTAMARGNLPAAICSASASTLLGVFITPVLVNLVVLPNGGHASSSLGSIGRILLQLMVPFLVGHLLASLDRQVDSARAAVLKFVDQGSILLVVYTAFSAAVIEGLWRQVPAHALVGLLWPVRWCSGLHWADDADGAQAGVRLEDEITIVFCGSKKSLASGIPMAKVLFPSHAVGAIVLPLMLFHQMQLMVCAVLAQRYARRGLVERSVLKTAE
jgi:sodium/bile acid cotransporter 7